jgi:hypothetical protein
MIPVSGRGSPAERVYDARNLRRRVYRRVTLTRDPEKPVPQGWRFAEKIARKRY